MGLLDITKAVAKGVKNDFESSAIYKLGDNILGGVSESSPESDDPVVLGGPSSNLEEPVTRFVNWGFKKSRTEWYATLGRTLCCSVTF